ncbi:hypothetical protein Y032_0894g2912 [Ancylostoma ceylanicum]|uniref:Uncharacterized protein n=1 Tax=Ancylostoma ceylanicum TaxID=53326 RepID=A0A016WA03_9BILA|nr:hypothetical protein Y032_0894g2912 [Ancylostoma ceylanicum]
MSLCGEYRLLDMGDGQLEDVEGDDGWQELETAGQCGRRLGRKYSDKHTKEVFHAYGFTTSSVPLKEVATNVAKLHSVATRRLQSPRLQPSPANRSRHRPELCS